MFENSHRQDTLAISIIARRNLLMLSYTKSVARCDCLLAFNCLASSPLFYPRKTTSNRGKTYILPFPTKHVFLRACLMRMLYYAKYFM